jgi:delta8-fatty-acid desaturase
VEHDPDNQHLPIFAVSSGFLGSVFSSYHERLLKFDRIAKLLVPYQTWTYYPILALGRFNLYLQSYTFLLQGQGPRKGVAWWHRYFEILGVAIFWYWYGYLILFKSIPTARERAGYVLASHLVSLPLHVMFTLSHFAMSTSDLGPGESFPMKMVRTTMGKSFSFLSSLIFPFQFLLVLSEHRFD